MPKPIASQEDEDPTPYLFVSLEQRRIDQSKPYDSKKNCWVPDEKEGYLLGDIKATKGDIVSVGLPGGEVMQSPKKRNQKRKQKKKNKLKTQKCFERSQKKTSWSQARLLPFVKPQFWYYKGGDLINGIAKRCDTL